MDLFTQLKILTWKYECGERRTFCLFSRDVGNHSKLCCKFLCSRNYSRRWEYNSEHNRQKNTTLIAIIFMWREQMRNCWIKKHQMLRTEEESGAQFWVDTLGRLYWECNIWEMGKGRKLSMGREGNCLFEGSSQWRGPTWEIQLLTMF